MSPERLVYLALGVAVVVIVILLLFKLLERV